MGAGSGTKARELLLRCGVPTTIIDTGIQLGRTLQADPDVECLWTRSRTVDGPDSLGFIVAAVRYVLSHYDVTADLRQVPCAILTARQTASGETDNALPAPIHEEGTVDEIKVKPLLSIDTEHLMPALPDCPYTRGSMTAPARSSHMSPPMSRKASLLPYDGAESKRPSTAGCLSARSSIIHRLSSAGDYRDRRGSASYDRRVSSAESRRSSYTSSPTTPKSCFEGKPRASKTAPWLEIVIQGKIP